MKTIYSRAIVAVQAVLTLSFGAILASPPNIVLIVADDLGIGDISAFNPGSKIYTPNLDTLCMNGIRFTDAHSPSSVCTPSLYGILTGCYAFRTNFESTALNRGFPPLIHPGRSTLPTMLARQGYTTACIGKWGLGSDWTYGEDGGADYPKSITGGPTEHGFDYFYGVLDLPGTPEHIWMENDTPTAMPDSTSLVPQRQDTIASGCNYEETMQHIRNRSIRYIAGQEDSDRPFFLYIPLTSPQTSTVSTEEYRVSAGLSCYSDFVLQIDDIVGNIVKTLVHTGQYDNTIVIFTSDNGFGPAADLKALKEAGHSPGHIYRGAKSDLFEGGHRVPLIVSWGYRYNGQTESGLISLTDFYATFAEMTGYALPGDEALDSFSMWPILSGQGKSLRYAAVHHSGDGYFALRSGKWKLLFCGCSAGSYPGKDHPDLKDMPPLQLYDLESDPSESHNLQAEYPETVKELTALMKKFLEEGRSWTEAELRANP